MSLSGHWARSTHQALSHVTDTTTKLALALTPVRSVIRVIDDHVPPMTVEWANVSKDKSVSATDFAGHKIIVNPLPMIELSMTTGLDICIGFAMHEAGHGKHSRDRHKYLIRTERFRIGSQWREREVAVFRPMRIAAYLWNLAEDVRMEGCVVGDWPGFEPYFDAVLAYMWENVEKAANADLTLDNPHPALSRAIQMVFLACRYPDRVAARLPDEATEIAWWQAWQADYLSDRVDTPTTIQRGLDHLALDEDMAEEMSGMAAAEERDEKAGEKARTQLDRLIREGIEGTIAVCINEDGEVEVLNAETADKINQLVREGLVEMRPILMANGASNPPLRISKPEETTVSRRAYVGKPDAESAALRAALVFRAAAPLHDVKLLKSGVLDDEELYRWGMGDYRVFSEHIIDAKPNVFMALLVDMSGSMSGPKLCTAQRLAQLFVWALREQEGVATQVWGHTADIGTASVNIFRLWEQGDPLTRLGLIDTLPHGNNADGHAIAYVVKQVLEQPQPQKVVIVLSDGLPSASGYGGERGMEHMRQVCEWARRQGVPVLQIAIDHGIFPSDQSRMFGEGNWFEYKTNTDLMRQLTRVMGRFA